MMSLRTSLRSGLLGALLAVAACSNEDSKDVFGGTSPPGSGGTIEIAACSLGCNTFQTTQVSCSLNDVFVNEELRIEFTQPVNLASVTQSSFRVRDLLMGTTPPGTFSLDPTNPRVVVYRPLLSFDGSGNPVFGLVQGRTYEVFLPGATSGDTAPFVMSAGNRPLGVRMRCTVKAGSGINDLVPGAPTVQVRVNPILKDAGGNPIIDPMTGLPFLGPAVLANNQTDIHRRSNVSFTFNDVMNPATLVNPATKESPSIRVFVDADGDVVDVTDQVELFGTFSIAIDQTLLRTTVTFDPAKEFPSAGPIAQPLPRRIVVQLANTIADLGGNTIAASTVSFVPERILFASAVLPRAGGEEFDTLFGDSDHGEDVDATGAFWGPRLASVQELLPGIGGGSGRLGDLRIAAGEVLTLYTDGRRPSVSVSGGTCVGHAVNGMGTPLFVDQLFGPAALVHTATPETSVPCPGNPTASPAIPALVNDSRNVTAIVIDNYDPAMDDPGDTTFVVRDGIFELASLHVEAGGVLRFVGPIAPRLYVRGRAVVEGRIEVNGKDASQLFDPQTNAGGTGGVAGPGGGAGGRGGRRPSGGGNLASIGGTANALVTALADTNGVSGATVPFPTGTPGMPGAAGAGLGGTRWPNASVCDAVAMTCDIPPTANVGLTNIGGVVFEAFVGCGTRMVGAPGSGGAMRADGGRGVPRTNMSLALPPNVLPPDTVGGSFPFDGTMGITLRPELGFFAGGGGGGGGGANVLGTVRAAPVPGSCSGALTAFRSNAGAGGGGGGGALQLQAGARLVLDGVVDASGGRGGQPLVSNVAVDFPKTAAAPGGSGAGGGILLQAPDLQVATLSGRLNVSGGPTALGVSSSEGGAGGVGFVRVEAGQASLGTVPAFTSLSQRVTPLPSTNPSAPGTWVSVAATGFTPLGVGAFLNQPHPISGVPMQYFPDAFSGAQSCWMAPEGNFFRLSFADDQPGVPGWNMEVTMLTGTPPVLSTVPYRGTPGDAGYANTIEGGYLALDGVTSMLQDPAALMPPTLGSPFVVRFQGARSIGEIDDPCDVALSGATSPILDGSLTPWVLHPAELNVYWDAVFPGDPGEASKRRPNLIRYQIVFNTLAADDTMLDFRGVDRLMIRVQPD